MATKTITGSYPGGYYLKPAYDTLDIAEAANVGGAGVTTTATQPSTINNLGTVQGAGNGIQLFDGGAAINGAPRNSTALIEAAHPVEAVNGPATFTNYGTIRSSIAFTVISEGWVYYIGVGVTTGTVSNKAGAVITNGISIGSGTVVNDGTVGGAAYWGRSGYNQEREYFYAPDITASVFFQNGGKVINGSGTNTSAILQNGIHIFGGIGTVVNNGVIGSPLYNQNYVWNFPKVSYSVDLEEGGSVTNGSKSNTVAAIPGTVEIKGGAGAVTNFGVIGGVGIVQYAVLANYGVIGSVNIGDGGTIKNFGTMHGVRLGSSEGTLAEEGTGVLDGTVNGGEGTLDLGAKAGPGTLSGLGSTITNFATIAVDKGASWSLSGNSSIGNGIALKNSSTLDLLGLVVNSGEISNLAGAKLAFDGDVSITTDPAVKAGRFSNAGLVEKTSGTGKSIIRSGAASLIDTGTIDVATGTIELTGQTVSVTGKVMGAGVIEFSTGNATLGDGSSVTTAGFHVIGSGAHVTVSRILAYAGDFSGTSNTELTISSGDMLELTGTATFFHDTIDGAGRLLTTGTASANQVTLGGTAQWYNASTVNLTGGTLTLGDSAGNVATFNNQASGVLDLDGNAGIGIGTGASIFKSQGLIAKEGGGTSSIAPPLTNTGTVEVKSGTLDLQGSVNGKGTLKIDAAQILLADGAVSQSQTVNFNGGGDKLVLTNAAQFAAWLQDFGSGDELDLRQFNPATTTLAYFQNDAKGAGVLVATDGSHQANITLLGQYMASGFQKASDGLGGSIVTYTPQFGIGGTTTGIVTEDHDVASGELTTGGTLTIAEPDNDMASFAPQAATAGSYGTFILAADGAWTYTANNSQAAIQQLGDGEALTDSFTAVSADGSASQHVLVTIHGTNDVPTIAGVTTGSVIEDTGLSSGKDAGYLVTGDSLTITDVDRGQSTFAGQASTAGTYGTFTLSRTGAWTYSVDDSLPAIQQLTTGQTLTDSFTAFSSDGSASQQVAVKIAGTSDTAFYGFNETSGSTVNDLEGPHQGAIVNFDPAMRVRGVTGNALSFNGVNQYVSVPDSPDWNLSSGDFSIQLYASFHAPPSGTREGPSSALVGQDEGGGTTNKWFIEAYAGHLGFVIESPSFAGPDYVHFIAPTPFDPVLDQWYLIQLDKVGSTYQFYVDRQAGPADTNSLVVPDVNAPLTIGMAEGFFFNGKIDDLSIANHALSGVDHPGLVPALERHTA
jgi:VCBS repeat-containing protein